MTFEQYLHAVADSLAANPEQRIGQAMSNVLHEHRPQLAAWTDYIADPFYGPEQIGKFLEHMRQHWGVDPSA